MIGLATLSTIVGRALAVAKQPVRDRDTAHTQARLAALNPNDARILNRRVRGWFSSTPGSVWLRRPGGRPNLPAKVSMAHTSRVGWVLAVGMVLGLSGACNKDQPAEKAKCSTQTKCKGGYKCVNVNDGGPVTKPTDLGECEEDSCAVTVPCATPQHATHPNEPCINDLVEVCDLHDPNKFCECQSTLPNQGVVTAGNTPTTG